MAASSPDIGADRRQRPGDVFWFDFVARDAAGFIGWAFVPGMAAFWAGVARTGTPFVLVKDLEAPLPRRPDSFELRAEGLWADATCETPFEHWTIGLEAFGVTLDDPAGTAGPAVEWGDRVALGFDLEWEALSPPDATAAVGGWEQPCCVHGEVLVGQDGAVETMPLDGNGWRGRLSVASGWPGVRWGGPAGEPVLRVAWVDPSSVLVTSRGERWAYEVLAGAPGSV